MAGTILESLPVTERLAEMLRKQGLVASIDGPDSSKIKIDGYDLSDEYGSFNTPPRGLIRRAVIILRDTGV